MNFKQNGDNFLQMRLFVDKNLAKIYNKNMENMILERETETIENQIGFDFLDDKIETETLFQKTKKKKKKSVGIKGVCHHRLA